MSSPPTVEQVSNLKRQLNHISNVISIIAYIGVLLSLISSAVACAIFFVSTTLAPDRKIFFSGILGVCTLGLQIVIYLSRSDPSSLLIFTAVSIYLGAFCLGLAIKYT